MKNEYVIVGVDRNSRDLPEDHAVRKNGPAMNYRVRFGRRLLGNGTDSGKSDDNKSDRGENSVENPHCTPLHATATAEIIGAIGRSKSNDRVRSA